MIKKIYLPLMLLMTLAFVGCNKDMKPLSADYFTVTPSPLEVVGGQVPATVTGTFPEKYFDKKSVVTVTPYLVYADGETAGTPFVYQGEKVEGNDQAISYKMGGVVSMPVNFKYIPAMRKSGNNWSRIPEPLWLRNRKTVRRPENHDRICFPPKSSQLPCFSLLQTFPH